MPIDLEPILDIVDGYEERKENARAWYIKNNIPAHEHMFSHLASLSVDDSSRAFEALRPLVARVRELERQRDWLADALQNMCAWNQDNESCYVQNVCPAGKLCVCAEVITKYDWIEAAEKAAKEARK